MVEETSSKSPLMSVGMTEDEMKKKHDARDAKIKAKKKNKRIPLRELNKISDS